MNHWIQSLSTLEYAALLIAVPATLLMILQTLLLLLGLHNETGGDGGGDAGGDIDLDGGFDGDLDLDGDGIPDTNIDLEPDTGVPDDVAEGGPGEDTGGGLFAGLKLLTLRGVVAFLAIFGWGTLWLLRVGLHPLAALFLGSAMGVWAMVLVALLLRVSLELQEDGTVRIQNALGLSGVVYLTIPAQRQGAGKVTVLVQEKLTEFDAVTDEASALLTGSEILVVGLSGRDTLVVAQK